MYEHQLDAKNRMRVPAKFREELGDDYVVTIGTGGCLYVLTAEKMKELASKLNGVGMFDEKALAPARAFLALSWEAQEDKQGRILIPENLRKYAAIEKDVVVLKSVDWVEIWSKETWDKKYGGPIDFTALAAAMNQLN